MRSRFTIGMSAEAKSYCKSSPGNTRHNNLLQKTVAAKEIFGSNLRLASRAVRDEPVFLYLSVLRAAESVGKKSESLILVQYS